MTPGATATMAKRATRRNTEEDDSAIKPRRRPDTGTVYSIISIALPAGGFIAAIAEDQTFSVTAPTRRAAEEAAELRFLNRPEAKNPVAIVPPEVWLKKQDYWPAEEEEGDLDLVFNASEAGGTPWSEIKRRHGL